MLGLRQLFAPVKRHIQRHTGHDSMPGLIACEPIGLKSTPEKDNLLLGDVLKALSLNRPFDLQSALHQKDEGSNSRARPLSH